MRGEFPAFCRNGWKNRTNRKQDHILRNDLRRKHWKRRQIPKKANRRKRLNYAGCAQIIMPENYIAMFATPTQEEAAGIIRGSLRAIDEAARQIKDSRPFPSFP